MNGCIGAKPPNIVSTKPLLLGMEVGIRVGAPVLATQLRPPAAVHNYVAAASTQVNAANTPDVNGAARLMHITDSAKVNTGTTERFADSPSPFVTNKASAVKEGLIQIALKIKMLLAKIRNRPSSATQGFIESSKIAIGLEDSPVDPAAATERRVMAAALACTAIGGCAADPELSKVLFDAIAFKTFGGLGLFLLGMKMMSDGLHSMSAKRLKKVLGSLTSNRITGLTVGTAVTATIQSSSVTTVMLVGLVDAGLMSLKQALSVVAGANIGTTITGWLITMKVTESALPMIGVGSILHLFFSNEKYKNFGKAITGLGLVFLGLTTMSSGFKDPVVSEYLKELFSGLSGETYLGIAGAIATGAVATGIVQSSSATLGVTLSLAGAGIIDFPTAAALVLGLNIGTTITAVLAAMRSGTSTDAKRVAAGHVLNNVAAVSLLYPFSPQAISATEGALKAVGINDLTTQIASTHTLFNVVASILFLSLLGPAQKLVERIVKSKRIEGEETFTRLSGALLKEPIAASNAIQAVTREMGGKVDEMLRDIEMALTSSEKLKRIDPQIRLAETQLDAAERDVFNFVDMLLAQRKARQLARGVLNSKRIADQLESASDELLDILRRLTDVNNRGEELAEPMMADLIDIHQAVYKFFTHVQGALTRRSKLNYAWVEVQRGDIARLIEEKRDQHEKRVSISPEGQNGESKLGSVFYDLTRLYGQIARQIKNVADMIQKETA